MHSEGNPPLVSVVIPAYNSGCTIERTLASVCGQTYKNLEIIVVDDGSQDDTAAKVEAVARNDRRVILVRQENAGVAAARNKGITTAKGEYVAPLDSDDVWYDRAMEKLVAALDKAPPDVALAYGWSVHIGEDDKPTGGFSFPQYAGAGQVFPALVRENFISNASATLIRRDVFQAVGGYCTEMRDLRAQGCEDWDMYLRVAEHYEFAVVPEFLIAYRRAVGSMSSNHAVMYRSYLHLLRLLKQRRPDTAPTLFRVSRSNFCIHLANESRRARRHGATLYWLFRALVAQPERMLFLRRIYTWSLESAVRLVLEPAHTVVRRLHGRPQPASA